MNLLQYAKKFAQDLITGEIYKKPLNPRDQVLHRAIGNLLNKAIESGASLELASDILLELLATKTQMVEMHKKIEELQKPVEPAPEDMQRAEQPQQEQHA